MKQRSILISAAVMAAVVGASPASASDGNGWSCISPFANFTNSNYPDDPPAPNHILDSLAIDLVRDDDSPLTATAGETLPLREVWLTLSFTDTRIAEQMYRRTGGATYSYRGIPRAQVEDTVRTFSSRTDNPADVGVAYWAYNGAAQGQPAAYVYVGKVSFGPPQVRTADQPENTPDFTYAAPTLSFGHRYLSHTGNSQFPLDAYVAIAASNTVEEVQTVHVKGYWTINIKDATPGSATTPANYNNDEVIATVEDVELQLPRTDWTPTGDGPVDFTVAPPRSMDVVTAESKGYDREGYNKPMLVRPFGSVYVRAQTEAYGASNDCIPGTISLANAAITAGQAGLLFGDVEFDPNGAPDLEVGDPATPGFYTTGAGQQKARGVRGRFDLDDTALPALASAPLVVPSPSPDADADADAGRDADPDARPASRAGRAEGGHVRRRFLDEAVEGGPRLVQPGEPQRGLGEVQALRRDGGQVQGRQDPQGGHDRRRPDRHAERGLVLGRPEALQRRQEAAQAAQVGEGEGHPDARGWRIGRDEDA